MARLSGVDLPREKRVEIALTYIYGIGRTRAAQTLAATGVNPDTRVKDLTEDDLVKLKAHIDENYKVEGDLRREVQADIRRKIEIGSYQGLRHRRGLPVHGQRTKTNARTRKGPKRTVLVRRRLSKLSSSAHEYMRTGIQSCSSLKNWAREIIRRKYTWHKRLRRVARAAVCVRT